MVQHGSVSVLGEMLGESAMVMLALEGLERVLQGRTELLPLIYQSYVLYIICVYTDQTIKQSINSTSQKPNQSRVC